MADAMLMRWLRCKQHGSTIQRTLCCTHEMRRRAAAKLIVSVLSGRYATASWKMLMAPDRTRMSRCESRVRTASGERIQITIDWWGAPCFKHG